jgi:hypothetical protein
VNVEDFLSLLKGVRSAGKDRWIARCPHHNDRSPSLAITKGDQVPILLHCFAGCDVGEIVGAVGLELSDLMPPRDPQFRDDQRARLAVPFTSEQALRCLSAESTFLFVAIADITRGKPLDELTKDRMVQAAARINEARRICNV